MSDIDFDELDRAVHDLMQQSGRATSASQQSNVIEDNSTPASTVITPAVDDNTSTNDSATSSDDVVVPEIDSADKPEMSTTISSGVVDVTQKDDPFAAIGEGGQDTQKSDYEHGALQDFLQDTSAWASDISSKADASTNDTNDSVTTEVNDPSSSTSGQDQSQAVDHPSSLVEQALQSLRQSSNLPKQTSVGDTSDHIANKDNESQGLASTASGDTTNQADDIDSENNSLPDSTKSESLDVDVNESDVNDSLAEQVLASEREPDSGLTSGAAADNATDIDVNSNGSDLAAQASSAVDSWPSFDSVDDASDQLMHSLDDIITPAFSKEEPPRSDDTGSAITAPQSAFHEEDESNKDGVASSSPDVPGVDSGNATLTQENSATNNATPQTDSGVFDDVTTGRSEVSSEEDNNSAEKSQKNNLEALTIDAIEAEQPTGTYGNAIRTVSSEVSSSSKHQDSSSVPTRPEPAIVVSPRSDSQTPVMADESQGDSGDSVEVNTADNEESPRWTKTRDGEPLESTGVAYDEDEASDLDSSMYTPASISELPHVDAISSRATANSYRPDVVMVEGNDTTEVETSKVNVSDNQTQEDSTKSKDDVSTSVDLPADAWPEFTEKQSEYPDSVSQHAYAISSFSDRSNVAVKGGEIEPTVSGRNESSRDESPAQIITTHSRPLIDDKRAGSIVESRDQSANSSQSDTDNQPNQVNQGQSIVQRPRGRFMDIVAGPGATANTLDREAKTSVRRHGKIITPLGAAVGSAAPVVGMDIHPTNKGARRTVTNSSEPTVAPTQPTYVKVDTTTDNDQPRPQVQSLTASQEVMSGGDIQHATRTSGHDKTDDLSDVNVLASATEEVGASVHDSLQPGDEKPLDHNTPFLPDAIVEKRPLNSDASTDATMSTVGITAVPPAPEPLFGGGDSMMGSAEQFIDALSSDDMSVKSDESYDHAGSYRNNSQDNINDEPATTNPDAGWYLQEDGDDPSTTPVSSYDTVVDSPQNQPWPSIPEVYEPDRNEVAIAAEELPLPDITSINQADEGIDSRTAWQDDDFGRVGNFEEAAATTQNGDTALALHQALQDSHDDRPAAPVYSDEEYTHPHDKKARRRPEQAAGWIWLLWVVLLLAVGAGLGAAYFALFG